jgi:hypothetical protein
MVAASSVGFMRHEGGIRSIETNRPLRHPAHPCNTLTEGIGRWTASSRHCAATTSCWMSPRSCLPCDRLCPEPRCRQDHFDPRSPTRRHSGSNRRSRFQPGARPTSSSFPSR